jgi:predicted GIY-YIG superfamily endonuclease
VLELEHGCFYVGQSASPEVRIDAHLNGKGAAWTKLHRPVKLLERRPAESKDWKHAEDLENQFTLMMMRKYGWQRVRGGFWTNTSDELTRKNLLHHQRHAELAACNPLPALGSVAPTRDLPSRSPVRRVDSGRPIRSMQRWSEAEDQLLRREYIAERDTDWIATQHCRTTTAIAARLVHLGLVQARDEARRA